MMSDGIYDRHQDIYVNVITNENNPSYVQIFIGSAAGPYKQPIKSKKRDRELHIKILSHTLSSQRKRYPGRYEATLENPDSKANWIILVSFSNDVDKTLVYIAHAIMTVLFGAYDNPHYHEYRPPLLSEYPPR